MTLLAICIAASVWLFVTQQSLLIAASPLMGYAAFGFLASWLISEHGKQHR